MKPFHFLADARAAATDRLAEKFASLRERRGISSSMVGEIDELAPVVERLAGQ